VCGQGILRCECKLLIGNIQQWEIEGHNLIWQMWCVWSGDTEM